MKFTPKVLSLPPYLSVAWSQIRAMYTKDGDLIINLLDGTTVPVPNLTNEQVEKIFQAHSVFGGEEAAKGLPPQGQAASMRFIQSHIQGSQPKGLDPQEGSGNASIRFGFENLEPFQSAMQHNPSLGSIPNMPKEILEKIASVARILAPGDIDNIPKAEPHCNCPHCQIARAIHGEQAVPSQSEPQAVEEVVSEEDLKFNEWDIAQVGDNLYLVTNRLDDREQYRVFLGEPVGCTCGKQGCEHVLAVLKS